MTKHLLSIVALIALSFATQAQSVIDAEDSRNPNDFYQKGIVVGKRAMPYPFIRESDVVWKTVIWRTIDLNEKFNQFFYFPLSAEGGTQGRINLVNLLVNAARNGEFEVFDDDDMTTPLDWEKAMLILAGAPYEKDVLAYDENGEIIYDEDGEETYVKELQTPTFDSSTATKVHLKEYWYIDKQDTRQKVRIVGLSFSFTKEVRGEPTPAQSFWVPMDYMTVRQVLVNANAYDENNDVMERSYDDVFIQRYFDSYITRESNTYNRAISQYLTGEDAILQSQLIEDKIFDIENDMWEY